MNQPRHAGDLLPSGLKIPLDPELEAVVANFSRIYLGGIPSIITADSAFLAFVCVVTATEALCAYRNGNDYRPGKLGTLFERFVSDYFPAPYKQYATNLWDFRNSLIHAFATGGFLLTHHNSQHHLKTYSTAIGTAAGIAVSVPASTVSATAPQYLSASGSFFPSGDILNRVILNAEDFYSALVSAAQLYFSEVRQSADLQSKLRERVAKGEVVDIREIQI